MSDYSESSNNTAFRIGNVCNCLLAFVRALVRTLMMLMLVRMLMLVGAFMLTTMRALVGAMLAASAAKVYIF